MRSRSTGPRSSMSEASAPARSGPRSPVSTAPPPSSSDTPPENTISPVASASASGGRRMKPSTSSPRAAARIASAICRARRWRTSADKVSPFASLAPTAARCLAPTGSRRSIRPSGPTTTNRAPASMAVRATISPSRQTAILVVPAADVDIHHRARSLGQGHGAGAMRRHQRLQRIARADRHELAGLGREDLADRPRVGAPGGHARQNERAGVDLVGREAGRRVLRRDERRQPLGVDRVAVRVRGEHDLRLEAHLAVRDDVARVEPLQRDGRDEQVRGRRPDIDADAGQLDLVLLDQRPPGAGEVDAPAGVGSARMQHARHGFAGRS